MPPTIAAAAVGGEGADDGVMGLSFSSVPETEKT